MPQLHEIDTTRIPGLCLLKDFIGFHIHEPKTHRAVTHDTFEVSPPSAATKLLFRVERHDRVACFPNTFPERISAKTNAISQGPNPDQTSKVSTSGSNAGSHHICIIED